MPTRTSGLTCNSSLKTKHKNTQGKWKYDLTCNKNKYVNQKQEKGFCASNYWRNNNNEIKSLRTCFWVGSSFDVQYKSWDLKQNNFSQHVVKMELNRRTSIELISLIWEKRKRLIRNSHSLTEKKHMLHNTGSVTFWRKGKN